MKLLIKEYLRSLKERNELDAILPDLLSEMGMHVYSRPAIGVRQAGVDMAAVGIDTDGTKKVFLYSIKAGDLKRADWNGRGSQSLQPSLTEIVYDYVPYRIPNEYRNLPVVVCITVGGDIDQNVDQSLRNFITSESQKHSNIEFQEWDGDRIANLLLLGLLSEEIVTPAARSFFRKSIAMLDEPEASYKYFCQLVSKLESELGSRQKDKIRFVRQINLCCWILYVWSREAKNLEASYLCSEFILLRGWDVLAPHLGRKTRQSAEMGRVMSSFIRLHMNIANELITEKYAPNASIKHGLSVAVKGGHRLDVNLKLFELVGRIALNGLWMKFFLNFNEEMPESERHKLQKHLESYCNVLVNAIQNNGSLLSPICDHQALQINMVCLFFLSMDRHNSIRNWLSDIVFSCQFMLTWNDAYPCIWQDYEKLINHPKSTEGYLEEATPASTLYPSLALWLKITHGHAALVALADFVEQKLQHCSMQLWGPNEASESHWYSNSGPHGMALTGLIITATCDELSLVVEKECEHVSQHFEKLSVMRFGYWPICLSAAHHHNMPFPLLFWDEFLKPPIEPSD